MIDGPITGFVLAWARLCGSEQPVMLNEIIGEDRTINVAFSLDFTIVCLCNCIIFLNTYDFFGCPFPGKLTVMAVPLPCFPDVMSISASWVIAISFTIANPRPVPGFSAPVAR